MIGDGSKRRAPRIVTGGRCGPWAHAHAAIVDPSRRRWATALFKAALPAVEHFLSPRAWAFSLLGLDAYCALVVGDLAAGRMRDLLTDRLAAAFAATESKDWFWFEDVLAYDNARLAQALLVTGAALKKPPLVKIGFASLRWLMALQTTPDVSIHDPSAQRASAWSKGSTSVRSTAHRGSRSDFSMPCGMEARQRRRVDSWSNACIGLVSGRQRPSSLSLIEPNGGGSWMRARPRSSK